ncbi:hypothetical protein RFI_20455 [Reticulomyxa filosa]|uniref:Transmembrane protein n=1 Tax=Reticulomyxa filosa TaxID=46433 RepID=X6MSG0_RETFI|nr:hypothetical protein RFI_20455 [Reticulomyxa filosa]|eukprot:ETO16883.1 hypothetical protein RFI_20455 [Reticulomyxa filosa]
MHFFTKNQLIQNSFLNNIYASWRIQKHILFLIKCRNIQKSFNSENFQKMKKTLVFNKSVENHTKIVKYIFGFSTMKSSGVLKCILFFSTITTLLIFLFLRFYNFFGVYFMKFLFFVFFYVFFGMFFELVVIIKKYLKKRQKYELFFKLTVFLNFLQINLC